MLSEEHPREIKEEGGAVPLFNLLERGHRGEFRKMATWMTADF
jgi:hypothetical protein